MGNLVFLALGVAKGRYVGIGEVEIVGELRMFAGYCGDALYRRHDATLFTEFAHLKILLLHIG